MSKKLQIGNEFFEYPTQGQGAGHGEDATAWACEVTDTLKLIRGPNDILLTSATLANNQTTSAIIPRLLFNTGQVEYVDIDFVITRTFDAGASSIRETGKIYGNYTGTDFVISIESTGDDSGVEIDVNASGQFNYTSTDLTDHVSSTIKFKARTIDQ